MTKIQESRTEETSRRKYIRTKEKKCKNFKTLLDRKDNYWYKIIRNEIKSINEKLRIKYDWDKVICSINIGNSSRLNNKERKFIEIHELDDQNAQDEDNIVHIVQGIRDRTNQSRRKYTIARNRLMKCKIKLPSSSALDKYKLSLNKFFELKKSINGKGYTVNCREKIEFVLKKFYEKNKIIQDNTFLIKLAGDGCSLNGSRVNILNFTFTIINDHENCMSSKGNYVLGKYENDFYFFFKFNL